MRKIYLASKSPRRKEILDLMKIDYEIIDNDFDEIVDNSLAPKDLVMSLSFSKAENAFKIKSDGIVIGSDTIVVLDGVVLGKPKDELHAINMLEDLGNKTHEVYTGVTLYSDSKVISFYEVTKVVMKDYSFEEIKAYVDSGEPFGKAGSYAIQGLGGNLVSNHIGSYYNIMGLPMERLEEELKDF